MAISPLGMADENTPAVINLKDGRSFRVFLMSLDGSILSTEFQKLGTKKTFETDEILNIDFTPVGLDDNELKEFEVNQGELFKAADYESLISICEPVVGPYGNYMPITNNLQETYGLLMQAYSRNAKHAEAAAMAEKLMLTTDDSLRLKAVVCAALAAANRNDVVVARELASQIKDPAAALYVKSEIEQAEGSPVEAIQTAVKVIAKYGGELQWLAPTEFLCAELYLETGRTNSALVTARQTAKLYEGTYIGNEADALHSRIEKLMQTSE
jgi:tetratricopeptide (TPR) repeat protein